MEDDFNPLDALSDEDGAPRFATRTLHEFADFLRPISQAFAKEFGGNAENIFSVLIGIPPEVFDLVPAFPEIGDAIWIKVCKELGEGQYSATVH